jgi:hypothetical protein
MVFGCSAADISNFTICADGSRQSAIDNLVKIDANHENFVRPLVMCTRPRCI